MTEKQRKIIHAAMIIISREGYSKCTIRNVANYVNVTEPAVYRHFKNKLDLLTQILGELQTFILPAFTLNVKDGMTLEECLQGFASELFFKLTEHPEYGIFLFVEEAFHQEKELKSTLLQVVEQAQSALSHSVECLQEKELCRQDLPSESLSLILMGTLRLMVSKIHLGLSDNWEDLLAKYVELFTKILSP